MLQIVITDDVIIYESRVEIQRRDLGVNLKLNDEDFILEEHRSTPPEIFSSHITFL